MGRSSTRAGLLTSVFVFSSGTARSANCPAGETLAGRARERSPSRPSVAGSVLSGLLFASHFRRAPEIRGIYGVARPVPGTPANWKSALLLPALDGAYVAADIPAYLLPAVQYVLPDLTHWRAPSCISTITMMPILQKMMTLSVCFQSIECATSKYCPLCCILGIRSLMVPASND